MKVKTKRGRANMREKRGKLEKQGDTGTEKMSHREGYRDRQTDIDREGIREKGKKNPNQPHTHTHTKHRDIYKQTDSKTGKCKPMCLRDSSSSPTFQMGKVIFQVSETPWAI